MRDTFVSPFDPAVRDLRLLHCAYGGTMAGQQPGGARAFEVIFRRYLNITAGSRGGWTVPQRGGVWVLLCDFQGTRRLKIYIPRQSL